VLNSAKKGAVNLSNYDAFEQSLSIVMDRSSDIPDPAHIDSFIARGIEQGKVERLKANKRIRRRMWSGVAVCLMLFACVFSIRLSPAFASLLRDIPGMETFVNLIKNSSDRGIGLALDNEFLQPLGISDEYGGITFTVEGMIADEARAVIFYTIDNRFNEKLVSLDSIWLTDPNGKGLGASFSYGSMEEGKENLPKGVYRGTLDVQMVDGKVLPNTVVLKAGLRQSNLNDPNGVHSPVFGLDATQPSQVVTDKPNDHLYTVTIPIDHARFAGMKKEYVLNQTITVEGQKITFTKATVNPLQVTVDVEVDPANSKQVFGAGDIRMTDENGEVWKSFWSSGNYKNHAIIAFESNYFHNPKELYLEGSWFRALDKDKMEVVVDTKLNKLIQAPDSLLKYKGEIPFGDYKKLTFSMVVNPDTDNMMYGGMLESKIKDASGKEYDMATIPGGIVSGATGMGAPGEQESYFYLDNKDYKQPLTFRVYNYPSYIRQAYKIRIK
jgi:hypothetical protein